MWVSGRLDPHGSLPSPDLGPGLPPSSLTWGQDPCVQALQSPGPPPAVAVAPEKHPLPDPCLIQGLRPGKVRLGSFNLMPASLGKSPGGFQEEGSPRPTQGLLGGRGHSPAAGTVGRRPGLSPPLGRSTWSLERSEPRPHSNKWGWGESWPSDGSGSAACNGPPAQV